MRKLKSKNQASLKRGGAKWRRTPDCVQVNAKQRVFKSSFNPNKLKWKQASLINWKPHLSGCISNPRRLNTWSKSRRAETKFSVWVNDLICNQTVASAASWESRVVIVLSSPQVWAQGIGAAGEEELNKSSLSLIRGSVMCYFSFLFCQLLLRVLLKRLWSLNSLLAGKQAQIHYNTLFTAGFSQLFMALNYGIHVFESVFKEGLNGLCIVHWCSRVWQRIFI